MFIMWLWWSWIECKWCLLCGCNLMHRIVARAVKFEVYHVEFLEYSLVRMNQHHSVRSILWRKMHRPNAVSHLISGWTCITLATEIARRNMLQIAFWYILFIAQWSMLLCSDLFSLYHCAAENVGYYERFVVSRQFVLLFDLTHCMLLLTVDIWSYIIWGQLSL